MRLPNPFKHEPVISISAVLAFTAWLADCLHTQQLDGAALVNWRNAALAGAVGLIRSFAWSPASVEKAVEDAKHYAWFKLDDATIAKIVAMVKADLGILEAPSQVDADTPAELPATLETTTEVVANPVTAETETETESATTVQHSVPLFLPDNAIDVLQQILDIAKTNKPIV